ncbi:MAG: M6 family metalloprotease domain-containing protein [Planctomycetota bacterium]
MLAPALVLAVYCLGQQPAPLQLPTVALTTEVLPPQLKTVETLKVIATKAGKAREHAVLGIRFGAFRSNGAEVQSVDPGSPAANAGLLTGDFVRSIGRYKLGDVEDLEKALASLRVNDPVVVSVRRPGVRREVAVELVEGEKGGDPGFEYRRTKGRFEVTAVRAGSGAALGGIKVGDTFLQVDKVVYSGTTALKKAFDKKLRFTVLVQREEVMLQPSLKPIGAKVEEVIDWKGKTFKLAVLLLEFPDRKHNASYASKDFEQLMFSVGEYRKAPDGRATYGSLRDYYKEMSLNTFDVVGKVFDWLTVPQPWAYYDAQDMGGGDEGTHTIFFDAIEAARSKLGAGALDAYDGVVFLYAGERQSLRGSQLWPHRSSVKVGNRHVPYYIIEEGGVRFGSIGVHCHEFGHMLGLPDFYGYGHRTGVGEFCTMAIGHLGAAPSGPDRPFHLCAWCKIRMGFMTARTIVPTDRQCIALRGVEGRSTEAIKVLLSPSGEEYYLLEVRNRTGFDTDFFRPGLLIWHIGDDGARERGQISEPIDLVEAHGKRYFDASLREESEVMFPNSRLGAFTPWTLPSSKLAAAGAFEVYITDIQLYAPPDSPKDATVPTGSVLFSIGDRARALATKSSEPVQPVYPERDAVMELDPVTKLPVPFTVGKEGVAQPGPAIMPRPKDGETKGEDGKKPIKQ